MRRKSLLCSPAPLPPCSSAPLQPSKNFGDLLDTVPVGVENMDFGARFDSGEQALIVGYGGVNDDQFAPLPTLVGSGARAIFFLG